MKILRISLKNIASLAGPHAVDFTVGDLSRNNLFAISGPTGSGKSTLLDALCLALFEDTPRLASVKGAVQLADKGGDTVAQRDPANLLRRGAAEGYAEVAFVGVDKAHYTARWSVRRARNKADGSLQATEMALFAGNIVAPAAGPKVGGDRKTEVKLAIVAKLGLNFDQFKRAVLLAQNDFAGFLKANDHDRAEILQALTGTDRFEKISKAVFAKNKGLADAVTALEARLAGISPLSPDARAELDARVIEAEKILLDLDTALRDRRTHADWHDRFDALSRALAADLEKKRAAEAALTAAVPRREALALTEAAQRELRPLADAETTATHHLAEAEVALKTTENHLTTAGNNAVQATAGHDAAKQAHAAATGAQAAAKPDLDRARALDAQLVPLDAALTAANTAASSAALDAEKARASEKTHLGEKARLTDALAALEKRLAPFAHLRPLLPEAAAWHDRIATALADRVAAESAEAARLAAVSGHTAAEQAAATARTEEVAAQAQAEAARLDEEKHRSVCADLEAADLPAQRAALDASVATLKDLHAGLKERDRHLREISQAEAACAEQTRAQTDRATSLAALDKQLPKAETAALTAKVAYDAAASIGEAATVKLRSELRPGCPCAVCGSSTHPFADQPAAVDTITRRLAELKTASLDADKTFADLTLKKTTLTADYRSAKTVLEKAGADLRTRQKRLADEEAKLAAFTHPAAKAVLAQPAAAQFPACTEALAELDASLKKLATAEKNLRQAHGATDEARRLATAAAAAHATLEKRLGDLAGDIKSHAARVESATKLAADSTTKAGTSLAALDSLFAAFPTARAAFDSDAPAFAQKFKNATGSLAAGETERNTLTESLARETQNLTHAGQTLAEKNRLLAAAQTKNAEALAARDTVAAARVALFAGRPVTEVESGLTRAVTDTADSLQTAADTHRRTATAHAAAQSARDAALVARDAAREKISRATAALDASLTVFAAVHAVAFDRAALTAALSRDAAWFSTERAALRALDDALTSLAGAIQKHEADRTGHDTARPSPDDRATINAHLVALEADRSAAISGRDETKAAQLADNSARDRAGDLLRQRDEARATAAPWGKLSELIGSSDGAKFRDIAQRHTLDILLGYANAQLTGFAGRYRLERVPQSLNLLVVDIEMGDERRSVHSLSGGESFLVSLALALGLASLTSNRLRIESLFIDEGFGSLDRDTLTTAMNALMHLEAQGRKIGVISHVTEMADAIPVQIRVEKTRHGASRLVVPGAPPAAEATEIATDSVPRRSRSDSSDTTEISRIAERILEILHRENDKVSMTALRKEIGGDLTPIQAARDHLVAQGAVVPDGKSLRLA